MNDLSPISRGGSRLNPLAFFIAVAISGGAMAADSQPLELDATQIEDSALVPADETGQLGYTVESSRSSTGLKLTPRQTPQSVTTITRQQMDDRAIHTIEQALETTPGVTASKAEVGGRTDYRARGYSISNWKVDGLQFRDLDNDGKLAPFEDWRLAPAVRARDITARMTLEEKLGTLLHGSLPGNSGRFDNSDTGYALQAVGTAIGENHVTSFISRLTAEPAKLAEQNNAVQALAEQARLGIPVTISSDPRNHFQYVLGASEVGGGFSQWPEPLGFAALADPALVHEFADIARREYRAVGIHMTLSPQADLATEPLVLADQGLSLGHMRALFSTAGLPLRIAHRTASLELLRSYAANGLGIGLSYTNPAARHAQDGLALVTRPIVDAGSEPLVLARLAGNPLSQGAAALAALIPDTLPLTPFRTSMLPNQTPEEPWR